MEIDNTLDPNKDVPPIRISFRAPPRWHSMLCLPPHPNRPNHGGPNSVQCCSMGRAGPLTARRGLQEFTTNVHSESNEFVAIASLTGYFESANISQPAAVSGLLRDELDHVLLK